MTETKEQTKTKVCPNCNKEMSLCYELISNDKYFKCFDCGHEEIIKKGKANKEILKAINSKIKDAIK